MARWIFLIVLLVPLLFVLAATAVNADDADDAHVNLSAGAHATVNANSNNIG
jgi:hypothetical protein